MIRPDGRIKVATVGFRLAILGPRFDHWKKANHILHLKQKTTQRHFFCVHNIYIFDIYKYMCVYIVSYVVSKLVSCEKNVGFAWMCTIPNNYESKWGFCWWRVFHQKELHAKKNLVPNRWTWRKVHPENSQTSREKGRFFKRRGSSSNRHFSVASSSFQGG